ncbi:hypothetical protein V3C99_011626, partial [Haemonchus contortus]
ERSSHSSLYPTLSSSAYIAQMTTENRNASDPVKKERLNMQIWHMEPYPCGDRRLPHHVFPPKKLSPDQLLTLTGVVYYKVDLDDTVAMKKRLSRVRNERKVVSSDVLTINDSTPDFDEKLEDYYEPTTKSQDVVSMVLEGTCYYDVEPEEDEWIRIQLERGDLIVIPQGVSHRFTVTPQNFVQLQRFFPKKPDDVQG